MKTSHYEQTIKMSYPPEVTFSTLSKCCGKIKGLELISDEADKLRLSFKAEMSFDSWGEIITIEIVPQLDGTSEVSFLSKSKFSPTRIDWGKNKKNIQNILTVLQEELDRITQVSE